MVDATFTAMNKTVYHFFDRLIAEIRMEVPVSDSNPGCESLGNRRIVAGAIAILT
ncbi:hypothetical protein GCM10027343_19280 [Noviherbaspirillum agri]